MAAQKWIDLAIKMIKKYGQTVPMSLIKTKDGGNDYDPQQLTRDNGGQDIYPFYGAPLDFNMEDIDNVTIISGQKMLWLPGTNSNGGAIDPQVADQVLMIDSTGNNVYFRVLEVTTYETESTTCAYLLKIGV